MMIIKMVATHPQQALWSLLAVAKSSSRDRAGRGISLLNKLKVSQLKDIEFQIRVTLVGTWQEITLRQHNV